MEKITTQRLLLRPFASSDLVGFYEYARDPLVGPNAGWKAHESLEESRSVLKELMYLEDVWALALRDTGRLIGSLGLYPDKKRGRPNTFMLGYVLGSPYWGNGYMTEAATAALAYAFNELQAQLVSIYHYPHNSRSRRVIEKCGFVFEGILREAACMPDGNVVDEVCYSLTRREYMAQSRPASLPCYIPPETTKMRQPPVG